MKIFLAKNNSGVIQLAAFEVIKETPRFYYIEWDKGEAIRGKATGLTYRDRINKNRKDCFLTVEAAEDYLLADVTADIKILEDRLERLGRAQAALSLAVETRA